MNVIALEGKSNVGKTSTINIVYQLLLQSGYAQVSGYFEDLANNDFLDVMTNNNHTIGIVSQGDYAIGKSSVKNHLSKLQSYGCDKVICACTIDRSPKIKAAVLVYPNVVVEKLPQPIVELQRIDNNRHANSILSYI